MLGQHLPLPVGVSKIARFNAVGSAVGSQTPPMGLDLTTSDTRALATMEICTFYLVWNLLVFSALGNGLGVQNESGAG